MKNLMSYAASMTNPPKGYGSIETGMKVAKYRGERVAFYQKSGKDYATAATLAQSDVVKKFGNPF